MDQGRGGGLLVGLVMLHVLCCGLPLFLAAGVLGGAGALLDSLLLLVGSLVALIVGLMGIGRLRRRSAVCCVPSEAAPSGDRVPLSTVSRGA
jgi:hypothetical protein